MNASQEKLQTLEDELEVPRQDLEDKKKEEAQRRKKIANLRKEIQVSSALSATPCQEHPVGNALFIC